MPELVAPQERAAKLRADYEKSTGSTGLAGLEAMALLAILAAEAAAKLRCADIVECFDARAAARFGEWHYDSEDDITAALRNAAEALRKDVPAASATA